MANTRRIGIWGMAALAIVALPVAALASHGKAGLWSVTMTMDMPGRQMPSIPPEAMARMKAMGIEMPVGHAITTQRCMTDAEVNSDTPPAIQRPQSGCKMTNTKFQGHTMSADMVCTGEMQGEGHFMVTYDSPEHYNGKMTFKGTEQGHPANMSNTFDGKWLSADCGKLRRSSM